MAEIKKGNQFLK